LTTKNKNQYQVLSNIQLEMNDKENQHYLNTDQLLLVVLDFKPRTIDS